MIHRWQRGMKTFSALRWRHNGHNCVSNHQPRHCLLNRLFERRSKKTSKIRVTGLCVGNSPGPVNSPHKGPVTRKMFPFDDVIMEPLPPYGRDLPVTSGSPLKRPIMRSFYITFVVNLNELLNNQPSCRWFETPWPSCDVIMMHICKHTLKCRYNLEKKRLSAGIDRYRPRNCNPRQAFWWCVNHLSFLYIYARRST